MKGRLRIVNRDVDLAATRDLSAAIFGARYRLEICAALCGRSQVTATELLRELGGSENSPSQSSISVELKRLSAAGLLEPLESPPGERHRPLAVVDSPIWRVALELVEGTK